MTTISAVIVAHNEEKKIEECLKSLKFTDEIVVVLDKCTDNTKKIVKKYTKNIIEGSWDVEGVRRNIGLKACTSDWILEIDADERISPQLAEEILGIKDQSPAMYHMMVDNYIGERFIKYGWLRVIGVIDKKILFYKGYKVYHEDKQIHPTGDLKGEVRYLKNSLTHKIDEDIFALIKRFNRNTSWRAHDIIENSNPHKKISIFKECFRLKKRLLKSFIVKKGYKEGSLGLLISILGALYPLISKLKAKEILRQYDN